VVKQGLALLVAVIALVFGLWNEIESCIIVSTLCVLLILNLNLSYKVDRYVLGVNEASPYTAFFALFRFLASVLESVPFFMKTICITKPSTVHYFNKDSES
jgi:hypothetical protein